MRSTRRARASFRYDKLVHPAAAEISINNGDTLRQTRPMNGDPNGVFRSREELNKLAASCIDLYVGLQRISSGCNPVPKTVGNRAQAAKR